MKRRVVITGIGVVAPNGIGLKQFSDSIFSGKSGIKRITRFDPSNFKVKVAAEILDFDAINYMSVVIARKTDRFAQLGVAAAKMAVDDARLHFENSNLLNAAVIIGSGVGGLSFHEETIINVVESGDIGKVAASAVPRITPNAVSAYIALQQNIHGCNQVISTACSSSAQAIGEAFHKVRNGFIDIAVTGGVEAPITLVTMAMYQAMMVLGTSLNGQNESASRPFDSTRNGFVMGEGSACLVLEELNHALRREAPIYAEIVGFGSNCGAYHMVTPNPTGEDAKDAMQTAIDDAQLKKEEIDCISAHGTSTKLNDLAETRAIKSLFGTRAYKIPVSAIKSMIGHTIGAAGALQAVASCMILKEERIPPTINLKNPDPECDLDYVPNKSREQKVNVIISNSFGFGSNNAVLVFKRYFERDKK